MSDATHVDDLEFELTPVEERFEVVYRGFDPQWAAMLADELRAEGINCHHVGTQNPALADIGMLGCEQRLEVPAQQVARALPLIEASTAPAASAPQADIEHT